MAAVPFISGDAGNDTIANFGNVNTLQGNAGDDTIAGSGSVKSISQIENAGAEFSGELNNQIYKDGVKFTGIADDGLQYSNGKVLKSKIQNKLFLLLTN